MEMEQVLKTLRAADDGTRFAVAQTIAKDASSEQLVAVAKLLVGEDRALRLGAIAVLRAAAFRPALGTLAAVAKMRTGHERALALETLADLYLPEDREKLMPALDASRDDGDSAVREARSRLMTMCAPREQLAEQVGAPTMVFGLLATDRDKRRAALLATLKDHPAPERVLAESLMETKNGGVRMDLIGGLGTLPANKIADAFLIAADGGDDDLLALLARMIERKLKDADEELRQRVAQRLLRAHSAATSPLTREALRSAARQLAPDLALRGQARDVATLEHEELELLLDALTELNEDQRAETLEALVIGLASAPARVGVFAETLYADLDRLDVVTRTRLATLCVQAAAATADDEDLQRHLGPLARLYARVVVPGARVPEQLVVGLRLSPDDKDRIALIELLAAVRTEESAAGLSTLALGKCSDEVKSRALTALRNFDSPEVEVLLHPDDTVELLPRFETPTGERLVADGRMLVARDGQRWVLGEDGAPVRESDTPHGGCRCCYRPHALQPPVSRPDADASPPPARPTCPVTGKAHLIGNDGPVLEDSDALGGCVVCDSLRPLERDGQKVLCPSCHQLYERQGDRYVPKKAKAASEVYGYALEAEAPPRRSEILPDIDDVNIIPPTEQDLEDLPEEVVRAMRANVVLYGKGGFREWGGTGIIIARQGNELAILSARQNVEETDGDEQGRRVPLSLVTVTGETVHPRVAWVARGGVDLALLTATVQEPEALAEVELALARTPKLGAELFAVGNQLGFPWSYSSGSVSGLRSLTTSAGLELRYVQTPMPLATGSGGGGLYHEDGGLGGVVSWYRVSGWSDSTNFAISAASVVATLRRERVRFLGEPLVPDE